jgi:hypothetical protein
MATLLLQIGIELVYQTASISVSVSISLNCGLKDEAQVGRKKKSPFSFL